MWGREGTPAASPRPRADGFLAPGHVRRDLWSLCKLFGLWSTSPGREGPGQHPWGCRQEGSALSHQPQHCILRAAAGQAELCGDCRKPGSLHLHVWGKVLSGSQSICLCLCAERLGPQSFVLCTLGTDNLSRRAAGLILHRLPEQRPAGIWQLSPFSPFSLLKQQVSL